MNNRVLIIGLGNIGFMYDVKKPRLVHSHAKAVMHSKNFILIGSVEKKIKLRKFFEKKFDLPTYGNLEKAYSKYLEIIAKNCLLEKIIIYNFEKLSF